MMSPRRLLIASLAANLVLSLVSIGWVAWIVVEPRQWFADAYAQKGPRGDSGPRGPVGPPGPEGPVGPDAEDAIATVEARVDDLATGSGDQAAASVDELASRLDDLESRMDEAEAAAEQLESDISDVASTVDDICGEFSFYSGALGDIYLAAC